MTTPALTESDVEQAALAWLESVGWQTAHGPDLMPNERADYGNVILAGRLRDAIAHLNPQLPAKAWDDAFTKLTRPTGSNLVIRNRDFHRMLVNGVTVEYRTEDGAIQRPHVRFVNFDDTTTNDLLAVNQFTVTENRNTRRADIVLFVNGLPLGVIELKNPADPDVDIWDAWSQLQTYKDELPTRFAMNDLLMVSDGTQARVGTLTAGKEWFQPWRTTTGESLAESSAPELQVMLEGVCSPDRLPALLRDFIVFEDDGGGSLVKKMAGYHQFHAVQVAVQETLRAAEIHLSGHHKVEGQNRGGSGQRPGGEPGDRRIGVVWHTQGAGKSLSMACYAGAIARHPAMENPTVVVLTDRNDLDDQLFGTFARCPDLLGQEPTQAETRADLRRKLSVQSGGVVFTTIQKFFPEERGDTHPTLSERRNIVVIADEAHHSQYDFIDGYARHIRDALPNASFIGFTGTPIELADASTRTVFGDYISIYDIRRSVDDGATVPIYYESRLAKLTLDESARPSIDPDFEEATEGEEIERKERLKTRWAQQEALVGAEPRLKQVAKDIVEHFEQRLEMLDGKAMIVCMSRRICVELYEELVRLRPDWHGDKDSAGKVKVVMTGAASDPSGWQQHIRNKSRREVLANRFRDPEDPFQVVIVRDMWLTGFDAPNLHTMYVDKPMRGHGLMQTITRVNRVFKDKPGGLVVDYLGVAQELKQALTTYTESGGTGETAIDQEKAVAVMQEKYEVCRGLFYGFDYSDWMTGSPVQQLSLLPAALEHILAQENGKDRCLQAVRELSQAFALAVPHEETVLIRNEVAFFQAIRAQLLKNLSTISEIGYAETIIRGGVIMSHSYPSDISREQIARILPTLKSARRRTKPRIVDLYDVFCGVLYLLKSGCQWRMLPADFPDWRTCYQYFRQWSEQPDPEQDSILEQVLKKTVGEARPSNGREEQTSCCIVDSQSVKNTDTAEQKGYDAGKKVSGSKRHIAVDTQGLPHAIPVTTADVTDRAGALAMFDENRSDLNRVQNVLVDGGYIGKPFAAAVQGILGAAVEVVKRNELHTFVVLPKRWVVERSFAWLEKCRRLWKNCERKLNTSLQMVVLAFMVLILKRL